MIAVMFKPRVPCRPSKGEWSFRPYGWELIGILQRAYLIFLGVEEDQIINLFLVPFGINQVIFLFKLQFH